MMKCFAIAAYVVLLTGCLKTRAELEAENTANAQQRQTVAQQRATAQERSAPAPAPVPEKAPPAAYRFEEYDEQMRTLSGRVDSLENFVQQQNAAKQAEGEAGKQNAELKFKAYEEELTKLQSQVAALSEEIARLKSPPPEPVAAHAKGKTPYDQGEELFGAKKWKEAIVSYQKYRDQSPKGKMYADATYKIGVCFQELGMKDEAKTFLEDVTVKFPNSKEAKKAQFRLKSLK